MSNSNKNNWWSRLKAKHPRVWALCSFPILVFSLFIVLPFAIACEIIADIPRIVSNWWSDVCGSWRDKFRDGNTYFIEWSRDWLLHAKGLTYEQVRALRKQAEEREVNEWAKRENLGYDEESKAWVRKPGIYGLPDEQAKE